MSLYTHSTNGCGWPISAVQYDRSFQILSHGKPRMYRSGMLKGKALIRLHWCKSWFNQLLATCYVTAFLAILLHCQKVLYMYFKERNNDSTILVHVWTNLENPFQNTASCHASFQFINLTTRFVYIKRSDNWNESNKEYQSFLSNWYRCFKILFRHFLFNTVFWHEKACILFKYKRNLQWRLLLEYGFSIKLFNFQLLVTKKCKQSIFLTPPLFFYFFNHGMWISASIFHLPLSKTEIMILAAICFCRDFIFTDVVNINLTQK